MKQIPLDIEIPEDMERAAEALGPERLVAMLDAMSAAAAFLHEHGWMKFGVVMQKGDLRVVLTLDGQISVGGDVPDSGVPPEIHRLAGARRPN